MEAWIPPPPPAIPPPRTPAKRGSNAVRLFAVEKPLGAEPRPRSAIQTYFAQLKLVAAGASVESALRATAPPSPPSPTAGSCCCTVCSSVWVLVRVVGVAAGEGVRLVRRWGQQAVADPAPVVTSSWQTVLASRPQPMAGCLATTVTSTMMKQMRRRCGMRGRARRQRRLLLRRDAVGDVQNCRWSYCVAVVVTRASPPTHCCSAGADPTTPFYGIKAW